MPVISGPRAPTHELPHALFTSLATPSRGSKETSVWRVLLHPGSPAVPHAVTREEILVVLRGTATVHFDSQIQEAATGDAIVVPVGISFALTNETPEPLELLCCLPVGGEAVTAQGTFVPPWAI